MPTALLQRLSALLTSSIGKGALTAVAVLGMVLGGTLLAEAKRPRKTPAAGAASAHDACKKDPDCVLVPDDCCSCNEGGKQHAIAKSGRDAYEAERTRGCAGTMCPQMMSQDPSCAQHAVCRGGACQLGEPAAR